VLIVLLAAVALAACGGDDEDGATDTAATPTATATTPVETTATAPAPTPPRTETERTDTDGSDGGGAVAPDGDSPESQPGGAGDEVPASSQAQITGDGGRLSPSTVRVPPFIAVRVVLVSEDGVEYELSGGGQTVEAGGEIRSASVLFEGLRAGERLVLSGPQGRVTIEANAEPGP